MTMIEKTFEATIENITHVTAFIDEQLETVDCTPKVQMSIDVVIDEIFGNIANYAYAPGKGEATVRFEYDEEAGMIYLTFIDGGMPFDPLMSEDPDVTLSAEERSIGGLGIYMTKKLMDEVHYEYKAGKNVLTLKKRKRG